MIKTREGEMGEIDQQVIEVLKKSKHYMSPIEILNPKLILDLGCWIGYTTMAFHKKWPNAIIVACEGDQDNYLLAKENTSNLNNVHIFNMVVGTPGNRLFGGTSHNRNSIEGETGNYVNVNSVDDLLILYG